MLLDSADPSKRKMHQYWDFDFREPDDPLSHEEYVEELDRLFVQAVQRQLVSDVEIGSYLSGGIDSGAITAVASASLPHMKSFTCGFDLSSVSGYERAFDERSQAEFLAAHLGTEQYEIVLSARDMERSLNAVARHIEEPRVGQSYPNFFAAKLASSFVKVVLSGTGGDELFGGYPWRYLRQTDSLDDSNFVDAYYRYWQRLVSNRELRRIFDSTWSKVESVWTLDIFRNVLAGHQAQREGRLSTDPINASLYFEAKTFLHGILVVEDKLSMANGLESRVPFLDNDVVDFAMKCPIALKLDASQRALRIDENEALDKTSAYFARTRDGKQIMRNVAGRHLPRQVSERFKQGFSSPDASWFRNESKAWVARRLLDRQSPLYEILDPDAVMPLVQEHFDGLKNRRLLVWSLLNMDEVMRDF